MQVRALLVVLPLVLLPGGAHASSERLTLQEQVGQLVVMSFRGTKAPEYVLAALREKRSAGVILFGGNVRSPGQLRALTGSLRQAGGRPVVAVDQEGGHVRRVPWVGPLRSEAAQAAAGAVRSEAAAAARELRALGITVNLAPVADVPTVSHAALASRAFSRDPALVSASVPAAVRGWQASGIAAAAKHFPGLGGAAANTDDAVVRIPRSRAELEQVDLAPFRAAVGAGVGLVMVGHARYPALDRYRIASQSKPIIDGILRGELGFDGVVVADSLEARASLSTGSLAIVAERAIRAGVDLLLLTGRGSYRPVYDHLLAVASTDPAFRARVRESAVRVLALKAGVR
jgi:beta-N-acetylhexosaminidase